MSESGTPSLNDSDLIHRLKNHIAIIVGFSDLLLLEAAEDDPRRPDLIEIHKAARDAMAMMPDVSRHVRRDVGGLK